MYFFERRSSKETLNCSRNLPAEFSSAEAQKTGSLSSGSSQKLFSSRSQIWKLWFAHVRAIMNLNGSLHGSWMVVLCWWLHVGWPQSLFPSLTNILLFSSSKWECLFFTYRALIVLQWYFVQQCEDEEEEEAKRRKIKASLWCCQSCGCYVWEV